MKLPKPTKDQIDYLVGRNYADLKEPCPECGAPLGEHTVGGPPGSRPYCDGVKMAKKAVEGYGRDLDRIKRRS